MEVQIIKRVCVSVCVCLRVRLHMHACVFHNPLITIKSLRWTKKNSIWLNTNTTKRSHFSITSWHPCHAQISPCIKDHKFKLNFWDLPQWLLYHVSLRNYSLHLGWNKNLQPRSRQNLLIFWVEVWGHNQTGWSDSCSTIQKKERGKGKTGRTCMPISLVLQ